MADEEKQQDETPQAEETEAEAPSSREEAEAEAAPSGEEAEAEAAPSGKETDPASSPEAEAPPDAEAPPELTPKERRKAERRSASGPPAAARTPQERAAERVERRRATAERRRRYRTSRRAKRTEPGTGTPPRERHPGSRKVRQGTVVSSKADKTITVRIEIVRRHRTYGKVVRRTNTIHAHDESNQANAGDVVRVVESRPMSRSKRWRLLEVLERAR